MIRAERGDTEGFHFSAGRNKVTMGGERADSGVVSVTASTIFTPQGWPKIWGMRPRMET
jgi:hypothetical protein